MNPNYDFASGLGPITDKILNGMFDAITNRDFKDKISDKLINPLTQIVNDKIKPYVCMGVFLYSIVFIMLLIIIYLLYTKNKKN